LCLNGVILLWINGVNTVVRIARSTYKSNESIQRAYSICLSGFRYKHTTTDGVLRKCYSCGCNQDLYEDSLA
jgi:hypothetical protein